MLKKSPTNSLISPWQNFASHSSGLVTRQGVEIGGISRCRPPGRHNIRAKKLIDRPFQIDREPSPLSRSSDFHRKYLDGVKSSELLHHESLLTRDASAFQSKKWPNRLLNETESRKTRAFLSFSDLFYRLPASKPETFTGWDLKRADPSPRAGRD